MKSVRAVLVVMLAAMLAGCVNMRSVDPTVLEGQEYAHINAAAQGKMAHITLDGGEEIFALSPHVAPDSTSWFDPSDNRLWVYPTYSIRDIRLVRADKGAIAGLGIGVLMGAALGTLRAVVEGSDPEEDVLRLSLKEKVAIYPIAYTMFSSFVTVPLGAIIGATDQYRFEPRERADASF